MRGRGRRAAERGTALLSTAIGVLVFLAFLLFAVQFLFSLYASSTVTAIANDAAHRAASSPASAVPSIEAEARAALGEVGRTAVFTWGSEDHDGDGSSDTLVLSVVAHPPRLIPASLGSLVGLTDLRRTIRVRVERFR